MSYPIACLLVVCLSLGVIAIAWLTLRRVHQAQHGEKLLLLRRRRILRVYHRRRDGRVYDPDRNPDVAILIADPPERRHR